MAGRDFDQIYRAFPDTQKPPAELIEAEKALNAGLNTLSDDDVVRIEKALDDFRTLLDRRLGEIQGTEKSELENVPTLRERASTWGGSGSTTGGFGWSIFTWAPADPTWIIGTAIGTAGLFFMFLGSRSKKNRIKAAKRRTDKIYYIGFAMSRNEPVRRAVVEERVNRRLTAL